MSDPVQEILQDLYDIDSSFKKHEAALTNLIRKLQFSKPDFSVDDAFVRRLRSDLLYGGQVEVSGSLVRRYLINACKNLIQSSAFGTAVALVLLVPLGFAAKAYEKSLAGGPVEVENASVNLGQEQEIVYKTQNTFGQITLATSSSADIAADDTSSAAENPSIENLDPALVSSLENSPAGATTTASYTYTGTPLVLGTGPSNVLERYTDSDARAQLLASIQNLGFELTDLTSVTNSANSQLNSLELKESKPFGYIVNVDLVTMGLTISENQAVWPNDESQNAATAASAASSSNTAGGPIAIAKAFLALHSIDTTNYASPIISSENTASSTATVLLPLIIGKQNVYNPDGSQYGIVVTVDQILGKVTSVENIYLQKYAATPYSGESDFNNVLAYIGAAPAPADAAATTTAEQADQISLDTPVQGLIHYSGPAGTDEYFVPGLIFPATSIVNGATTTSAITVPLLKDFIENASAAATNQQSTTTVDSTEATQ